MEHSVRDEMRTKKILFKQVDKLCTPYQSNKNFNFEDAIKNLIELKKTENVDDRKFIELVVETNQPIAPLYSAAIICKMITRGRTTVDPYDYRMTIGHLSAGFSQRIADWPYPDAVSEENVSSN